MPNKISIPPDIKIDNIIFEDDVTIILASNLKSILFLDDKDLLRYYGYIDDLTISDTDIYDNTNKIFFDTEMNNVYIPYGPDEDLKIVKKNMSITPVLDDIALDGSPVVVYSDPDLNRLYVAETDPYSRNSSISIIDVNTNKNYQIKFF